MSWRDFMRWASPSTRGLGSSRSGSSAARRRRRPAPERLEGRTLLSTLTVTSAGDHGPGSLRAAIATAVGGDTIDFDRRLRGVTIGLTSGELVIDKALKIEGPGALRLSIDAGGLGRAFRVSAAGSSVEVAGLSILGGLATAGGGILVEGGAVELSGDVLTDNRAVASAATETARGGAVAVVGAGASLSVVACLLTNDGAAGAAGLAGAVGSVGVRPSAARFTRAPGRA